MLLSPAPRPAPAHHPGLSAAARQPSARSHLLARFGQTLPQTADACSAPLPQKKRPPTLPFTSTLYRHVCPSPPSPIAVTRFRAFRSESCVFPSANRRRKAGSLLPLTPATLSGILPDGNGMGRLPPGRALLRPGFFFAPTGSHPADTPHAKLPLTPNHSQSMLTAASRPSFYRDVLCLAYNAWSRCPKSGNDVGVSRRETYPLMN